jgi:hypothetical protein
VRAGLIDVIGALIQATGMNPETFVLAVRVFAAAMTIISLVLIVTSIRRMRRPVPARWSTPILGLATTLAGTGVFWLFVEPRVNPALMLPLLLVGLAIGLLQGLQSSVYREHGGLIVRRTTAYMVLWGLAFVATLALGQIQQAALQALGALTVVFTLGIAVGANITLGVRQAAAR